MACTSDLCRMGASCIYPRHLQKAREADIVVTNHYKLPVMDSQIQEPAQVCLIDEADQFPDNLRNAATIILSSYLCKPTRLFMGIFRDWIGVWYFKLACGLCQLYWCSQRGRYSPRWLELS